MTTRKRGRRMEDLSNSPMVRRSPRLSSRPPSSHQLHHQFVASSRPSLGGYNPPKGRRGRRSTSRSRSPSTILNESGQSVPPSFERGDQVVSNNGLPRHLYGLDGVEDQVEVVEEEDEEEVIESGPGGSHSRIWNVYDKERITVTTPHPDATDNETEASYIGDDVGCLGMIVGFFTSLIFKLGSLLYLASASILCLDVIILHRLFNFAPVSQRVGVISRFFILLLVLFGLIGFLLGGHVFRSPSDEPVVPPGLTSEDIHSLRSSILHFISTKLDADMRDFETRFRDETEVHIKNMIENSESKQALHLREEMGAEAQRRKEALDKLWDKMAIEMNNTVEYSILRMKSHLESKFAKRPDELDIVKKTLSTEINDLRDGQNQVSVTIRRMLDEIKERQQAFVNNISALSINSDDQEARLSRLELKHKDVVESLSSLKTTVMARLREIELKLNDTIPEHLVVDIFYQELEKSTANKESPLRLWLNLIFSSKNDLQLIQKQIDELKVYSHQPGHGSYDLSRKDIEQMIAFSLRRFGADRIGKFDFALESAGGCVLLKHCSPTFTHSITSVSLFGMIPLWHATSSPKIIIQPSIYPGNCWAMQGQSGHATIKLREEVIITSVTIDHIPEELAPNSTLDTAPKDFLVQGYTSLEAHPVSLGQFTYKLNNEPIQEFQVEKPNSNINFVRFKFLSNYGNLNFTCIYRVRVHGHYA